MSSVDLTMSEDSEKPEEDNILEVLDTRLLKPYKYPKIVYEGYLFHYHKKCMNHIRWKCNKVYSMSCQAVLRTTLDMDRPKLIKLDHEHVHEVDKSAINALKMNITQHRASSKFQNSTVFKPKNGYVEIKLYEVDTSVNNKMLKQKNGYADININEEDKPNKLLTCCTSYNQNVDPHDPNYEHRYTDEREQINKNKNINDISFDFECPKIRITRNTSKQKKIDMNNVKNDITDNSRRCSFCNDEINNFNKAHKEKLSKKQNLIVSKKKKNHEQMNQCTLLTNKDIEKNASNTNINEKINNKTIDTSGEKKSLFCNINKNNNALTSINTYEEINPSTSITHKETNTLTTNILTSNEHSKINMLTTNTHIHNAKKSLKSNSNKDENTFATKINNDINTLTSNTHEEIFPLHSNILTHNKKNSLISNINEDKNTLTRSTHKEIFPLTTSILTRKRKHSLISNIINKDENTLTSHINNDKNTLNSNTHKEINTLTTSILTRKRKHSLISNINEDKKTFTGNLSKNSYVLTRNNYKNKNTIISNTPTILTSKINITPSIKSCVNKFIGVEDDTRNIDNNSDQNHTDHRDGEPNNVTNDVNLVKDDMISIYCRENWTTILKTLSDPLKGIKVFESILFNKVYEQMILQRTNFENTKQKIKGIKIFWELKIECLKYSMKKFKESTKCDINTRHISIQSQNQNQMDTTCTNIGVAEENNSGINKKGLHHCVEVLVLNKDGQLSTMEINGADWQSPEILKNSHESVQILPVAIKRAFKSNLSPPSEYPILNKLLTKSTSEILKLDKRNTLNTPANNQMNASLPDDHLIRESNNSI